MGAATWDIIQKLTAAQARADAAEARVRAAEALANEWEKERDVCLAWISDPRMHVDPGHPDRLSRLADLLNRHAEALRGALADPVAAPKDGAK